MFGSFRRHQKWIWILGVLVIIPSFVIFFSPDAKWRAGGVGSGRAFTVYGKPVTIGGRAIRNEEFNKAYDETLLGYFFRGNGSWPGNEPSLQDNLQRDAIFRVFLIGKLDEMGIRVSERR